MTSRSQNTQGRGGGAQADRQQGGSRPHRQVTSSWEWVAAAFGVVLVLGAIGYMTYHAISYTAKVPDVTIEPAAIEAIGSGHVVRLRAKNHSNATAASLKIEGELRQGSTIVETAETTLDYLPAFSERHAGLFFENDPNRYELKINPKGYDEP